MKKKNDAVDENKDSLVSQEKDDIESLLQEDNVVVPVKKKRRKARKKKINLYDDKPIKKRKMKKSVKIILIIIILLLVTLIGYFVFDYFWKEANGDSKYLNITLNGDKSVEVLFGSEYTDLGSKAKYKDIDLTSSISVSNDVDLSKVGTYHYTYKVKYKSLKKEIIREVKVIDNVKPTLKLNGQNEVLHIVNKEYKDLGVTAKDNYDGDLTSKVEVDKTSLDTTKVGDYVVTYKVKDSSGNENSITRKVKVVNKSDTADKIAILNYHFFYDINNNNCHESICLRTDRFRQQLQYLKDNNFHTLTIHEFVQWMYGEIEIPKKSVLITIDDGGKGTSKTSGNYLIPLLEEYKMHGTLFLISAWWNPIEYKSDYLDVQSHGYDIHYESRSWCQYRSKGNCIPYDDLVKDLKKSIEVVKDDTSFCFPFYEYTDSSIKAVKESGFKVAFIGGYRKASRDDDKYKVPRYPIYDSTSIQQFKNMVNP